MSRKIPSFTSQSAKQKKAARTLGLRALLETWELCGSYDQEYVRDLHTRVKAAEQRARNGL